ncbi:MAG: DNA-binding transcriptional LysR family regulator [Myxococcota bacterium]
MKGSVDEIQVFVKVVEAESFTGAAELMGMPKSTVSRYVSKLEDRLGVRLLNRSTRQLRPTDVGRSYYSRCVRIIADLEDAERAITSMQEVPTGPLRITAPLSFGYIFLGELLSRFLAKYPDVQVCMALTDRKVNLIEEGFDVAIRGGVLEDSSLIARKLGGAERVICASPSYLAARGTPKRPADLKLHDCLIHSQQPTSGGGTWRLVDGQTISVSGPLVVNNTDVLRQAACAGHGLLLAPRFMVEEDLAKGALVMVLDGHVSQAGGLYILYPHARHLSAKVRAFVDFAVENLGGRESLRDLLGSAGA